MNSRATAIRFEALDHVGSPHNARILAWLLALMLIAAVVALTATPWQQNIMASGQVVAFDPVRAPSVHRGAD